MLVAILFCVLIVFLANAYLRRQRLRRPPSPPADPILGHLRVLSRTKYKDELFFDWGKTYGMSSLLDQFSSSHLCTPGDVIYLNSCGKSTVVLNSEEAAKDLLEKRGAIYSDRPAMPMMNA